MPSNHDSFKLPYLYLPPFENDSLFTPSTYSNFYASPSIYLHNAIPEPWLETPTNLNDQFVGHSFDAEQDKEKGRCTYPECRKVFKDLKAHILTHQNDRPEKCPIQTCEYHTKGFARKYDKNRHTLTHYKGTLVCGFCPGSGSPAEKSFNRADVFKRHLMSVHGVMPYPPNNRINRKKSNLASRELEKNHLHAPDATGKCSTCNSSFSNAQDFYEHLDDCVLRIVQQEDPSEAINAARLADVENDIEVQETLRKHNLTPDTIALHDTEHDEEEMDDEIHPDDTSHTQLPSLNTVLGTSASHSLMCSKDESILRSRHLKRKDYPSSWCHHSSQMKMKKRVVCVFDGPRRLLKDDMVLGSAFDACTRLAGPSANLSDLGLEALENNFISKDTNPEKDVGAI